MCFSASASFGVGAVLIAVGVATIKKTNQPSQLLFASIPLIFGIQQMVEGVLWLTIPNPDYINTQRVATYAFLIFAQIIWPLCVPVAILLLEKKSTRKTIQKILVGAGVLVSTYLTYSLISFDVKADIVGYHITYIQDYPLSFRYFSITLYALATVAPPFFSSIKRMWILGAAILISYIVAAIFYEHYIISVWCFFAAVISISIYFILLNISRSQKMKV